MKLAELAVDVNRAENGAWVNDVPDLPGLRLKVRASNNADWRRLQMMLFDKLPRKKKLSGRVDPDETDRIITQCLIDACLLDWDGLEDDDGKAIPYSKQMAEKLLMEPEYRRFRDAVAWAANVVTDRTDADQKDAAGNLLRLSVGDQNGEPTSKAG